MLDVVEREEREEMALIGIVLLVAGVVAVVSLTLAGPFLLSRLHGDGRGRPGTTGDGRGRDERGIRG
ncbi:hypothetical protein GCM10017673_49410 [Streptosporangium violaceochromogenes]|nr:hypothetical protein GCM10017673_49410 [Streptosporangium violaceochromogenes]